MFLLMFDANKAFHRVWYCKLYNEPLYLDISPLVLTMLIYVDEFNIDSSVVSDTN